MKKHLFLIIKFTITIGILLYLYFEIEWQDMQQTLTHASASMLILTILIYAASQFLNTYKWSVLLHSHGPRHPMRRLLTYNFIGMFCNTFMPGMVGGDVQKCYAVFRDEKKRSGEQGLPKGRLPEIISSILVARITGVLAMIWQANLAYFFLFPHLDIYKNSNNPFLKIILPYILLGLLAGTVLFFIIPRFFNFNVHQYETKTGLLSKLINPIKRMAMNVKGYVENWRLIVYVMILSLIFQGIMNFIYALVGMSLHLPVSWIYYFIAIPLVTLISSIPISISGFGVREGAMATFFSFVGVGTAEAVLLSFSVVFVSIVPSLFGGLLLLKEGFFVQPSKSELEGDE